MKKAILPAILFAAVFAFAACFQRFTMENQEFFGFFAWMQDYLREVFSSPWPLSSLLASFLLQLYYYPLLGAAITAVLVTAVFLLCRTVFRAVPTDFLPLICACCTWYFAARVSPAIAVKVLLCTAAACLLSLPFKMGRRDGLDGKWWCILGGTLLVIGTGVLLFNTKKVHASERWAKVECCARKGDWNGVLEAATLSEAHKSSLMLPYALMAHNAKGDLLQTLFDYPVQDHHALDMEDMNSRQAYCFNALCYEYLGLWNESLHNSFQAASYTPHYMTQGLLRQIIRYNYLAGNKAMVLKYAGILDRTLLGSALADSYRKAAGTLPDERESLRQDAPVRSTDQLYNLLYLQSEGNTSRFVVERTLAYLLADRDLTNFEKIAKMFPEENFSIPENYLLRY